jgi:hypothetical protein
MLKTALNLRELFLHLLKPVFPKAAIPVFNKSVNHSLLTIPFIRTDYNFRHFEYLQYIRLTPSCQLPATFLTPSSKFLEFDLFLFGGDETRQIYLPLGRRQIRQLTDRFTNCRLVSNKNPNWGNCYLTK